MHTGQLYFSDAVTDAVYRRKPYKSRPHRNVRNAADAVFRNGGKKSVVSVRKNGTGYIGSIRMGVQT